MKTSSTMVHRDSTARWLFLLLAGAVFFTRSSFSDIYDPNSGLGPQWNLNHTQGVLTIKSDTLSLIAERGTYSGENDGGGLVFRLK